MSDNPLSPQGWRPRNRRERHCLCESGWLKLDTGWKFLFGGSVEDAKRFHDLGLLDAAGFTSAGTLLRDEFGRGKAGMLDTLPPAPGEAA